jgi:hypothetical protein
MLYALVGSNQLNLIKQKTQRLKMHPRNDPEQNIKTFGDSEPLLTINFGNQDAIAFITNYLMCYTDLIFQLKGDDLFMLQR